MNNYILGIILAFFGPIMHGWANIIDNYFTNKIFKKLEVLVFISQIFGLLLLPIVCFIDLPHLVSIQALIILFIIALIEILYLFPYYYSLRHADTSVVAALFSVGKLFVPLFAFLFIHEQLSSYQYIGFFILTLSSIILSVDFKKMSLNKAFAAMLGVSMMLAAQSILLKYVYESGVGWGSSVFWMNLFQFIIASSFLLNPKNFNELSVSVTKIKSVGKLFLLTEILSWGGTLSGYYALYFIPVSISKGIGSTQPVFVLIYAFLFMKFAPKLFKEYLGKDGVMKKIALFILTIIGVILIK